MYFLVFSFENFQRTVAFSTIKVVTGGATPMKDAEEIPECKSWLMMTKATVDDIYKFFIKCYVEQEVWTPWDGLKFLAVLWVYSISKTTDGFRSTVFPLCSRS